MNRCAFRCAGRGRPVDVPEGTECRALLICGPCEPFVAGRPEVLEVLTLATRRGLSLHDLALVDGTATR